MSSYMSTFAKARLAFEAAEDALDAATTALHEALCGARTRLQPFPRCDFAGYRFHSAGLTITYDDYEGGQTYIEMTNEDLIADDPAQAYLIRKDAEYAAHQIAQQEKAEAARLAKLQSDFAALTPQQRIDLLCQLPPTAEDKA